MPDTSVTELHECILTFDLHNQKFLFVSPAVKNVLGYPAADFYQNPNLLIEITDPADLRDIQTKTGGLKDGGSVSLRYKINAAGKTSKWVNEKRSLVPGADADQKLLIMVINEDSRGNEGANLNEKFLNSLIDSQTNFLIRIDINGHFTFVNKQFLKTLGYKKSELEGKHASIVTLPGEEPMQRRAFFNAISHPGKVVRLADKKRAKNGDLIDAEWEFISITDTAGNVIAVQGIGRDVTQRHIIENEVKQAAEKLHAFIESINDYFFIIDTDWRFVRVNAAFEKVSGKSRDELLGQSIWEVFPIVLGTAFERAYRKAAAEKVNLQFVEHVALANMWFDTSVYPSAEGLMIFMKNITIEKLAQEEAIKAQNSLDALINTTDDLIWSIDKESRYVYMNTAYRTLIGRITGVEPREGDFSYLHKGYTVDEIETWERYYRRALAGERFSVVSDSIDMATKEALSFEVRFNPVYKANGEITGVGCFSRDITERLVIEKAIVEQNERLRHIASVTSHELRRPVASMLGLINIMDKENFFNPDNEEIIAHLHTVGNEIDEVIRLIVDKSFIEGRSIERYQSP
jgi:PAS domain S-box-containing protein